jgi:DNA repair exonuclease SbcCD ATPase subunit
VSRPALFATALSVKNFRGYGQLDVELPAGPCVVLLSGPNGLGKTSLFEAVEWALTGTVKRLDLVSGGAVDPRDLARRAQGVDAFEVGLSFRDEGGMETRVSRTQLIPANGGVPDAIGTKVGAVADALRADDARWNVTGKNLAEYLHLTHFHAQVAALRLVTFTAKERWVRVSPLAGADRFERVRTNLTNSKSALTKLRDRRESELADVADRRDRWHSSLARLGQLQALVAAARDVVSPREALENIVALRLKLSLSSDPVTAIRDDDIVGASEAIRSLRVAIEQMQGECIERLGVLARLRLLPRQWADLTSQRSGLAARTAAAEQEVGALTERIGGLAATVLATNAAVHEAQQVRSRAVERHDRLVRALRDRADLVRLEQEATEAAELLRVASAKLEEAELELLRRRDELAAHEGRVAERERVRQHLEAIDLARASLEEIQTLRARTATEETRLAALVQALRDLDASAAMLSGEVAAREEVIAQGERGLEELRTASAALHGALLVIAQHVKDDDIQCPVCESHFGHGQLRAKARSAVEALDPRLAEAERRLDSGRSERADLRTRGEHIASERRKLAADVRVVTDNIAELQARVGRLRSNPLLIDSTTDDAVLRVQRLREEQEVTLQRLEHELSTGRGAEQLRDDVTDGGTACDDLKRAHLVAQERHVGREVRASEVRARVAQVRAEHVEVDATEEDLLRLAEAAGLDSSRAKDTAEALGMELGEAQRAQAAADQVRVSAMEELEQLRAQRATLQATLDGLRDQWLRASLSEPVAEPAIDVEIETVGVRRAALAAALARVTTLSDALQRWQQAAELRAVEQEIRRQQGALERDAYTKELGAMVERAQVSAATAQRARDAANELSATLGQVTADFGEQALRPFGELFRRYLRALVHDERFHSIEATYAPSARAAALRFMVDIGGATDAEYILSEGQLGEVSLAAMLAAGTTFPWSRWRALLLDDPTQYNDLIHATALFDVLRNLVRFARYQIVVSTHDNEQANFLRRKLDGIDIPWVDCRYLAHSAEGIVVDTRSSGHLLTSTQASGA